MKEDPFKKYLQETEPGKREKGYAWHTAIGLQAVDGLKTSEYLTNTALRNIEGEITFEEADSLLHAYYEEKPTKDKADRTEEADKVSSFFWKPRVMVSLPFFCRSAYTAASSLSCFSRFFFC